MHAFERPSRVPGQSTAENIRARIEMNQGDSRDWAELTPEELAEVEAISQRVRARRGDPRTPQRGRRRAQL